MRYGVLTPFLCALVLLAVTAHAAHAQTLMENSRIAFVTDRDGNDEIYLMRVDGSDLVNLTNDPSNDVDPAWSPEGDKIAFASDRDGDFDIYVMDRDGANVTQLVNRASTDLHPSWAADGERIMFASDRFEARSTIYIMNADGTNQTQVSRTEEGGKEPAWSPDISRIVYSGAGDRDGEQWIVALYFGRLAPSISRVRKGSGVRGSPAWSHGGWNLAWEEPAGDGYDLWIKPYGNSTTSPPRRLTGGTPDDRDPTWAPDGDSIAFSRDGDIWRLRLSGPPKSGCLRPPASTAIPSGHRTSTSRRLRTSRRRSLMSAGRGSLTAESTSSTTTGHTTTGRSETPSTRHGHPTARASRSTPTTIRQPCGRFRTTRFGRWMWMARIPSA